MKLATHTCMLLDTAFVCLKCLLFLQILQKHQLHPPSGEDALLFFQQGIQRGQGALDAPRDVRSTVKPILKKGVIINF